jgi:hypothetical protein
MVIPAESRTDTIAASAGFNSDTGEQPAASNIVNSWVKVTTNRDGLRAAGPHDGSAPAPTAAEEGGVSLAAIPTTEPPVPHSALE